ncbi:MAG TPA: hypothetical protein VK481_00310 [Gemmatimonadaceae bacterium]|jgi:hypothetical protein|nr:hypothetical protein [Gemmatimonadaceae bacterium]
MRLERAFISAGYSLLIAGLGQLSQERRGVALWHFLEVFSLLVVGVVDETHRPLWIGFALVVNAWSVIDAFVWEIRQLQTPAL